MSSISSPTRITPARLMTLPLENEGIHLVGRYRQRVVLNLADGLLLGDAAWLSEHEGFAFPDGDGVIPSSEIRCDLDQRARPAYASRADAAMTAASIVACRGQRAQRATAVVRIAAATANSTASTRGVAS